MGFYKDQVLVNHSISVGIGAGFAYQVKAKLADFLLLVRDGGAPHPMLHHEHSTIDLKPDNVRSVAQATVAALGWTAPWRTDADYICLKLSSASSPAATSSPSIWSTRRPRLTLTPPQLRHP